MDAPTRSAFFLALGVPAGQSIIFHFSEYLATTGGIYKSKKLMSLALFGGIHVTPPVSVDLISHE